MQRRGGNNIKETRGSNPDNNKKKTDELLHHQSEIQIHAAYILPNNLVGLLGDVEGAGLATLAAGEEVGVLVEGRLGEHSLSPEIGSEVLVAEPEGSDGRLDEVTLGLPVTLGGGVAVGDTGELKNLLGAKSRNDAGTTGSGDEAHGNGTSLAGELGSDGVGLSDLVTPVALADGENVELGVSDRAADRGGNLLGALLAETNVVLRVTNDNVSLKAGPLTGAGLLLDGHDLDDLILELATGKELDNLVLLDGDGEKEDLLHGLDLAILHKTTKLGKRNLEFRTKKKVRRDKWLIFVGLFE